MFILVAKDFDFGESNIKLNCLHHFVASAIGNFCFTLFQSDLPSIIHKLLNKEDLIKE
jgi:hypothetical protein